MIRRLVDQAFNSGKYYISAVGLSTDVKPTEGIITGSKFVEVDTGIGYLFDETSGQWHENQQLSAAVQAYFEDHPEAIDQAAIEAMFGERLDGIEEDIGGLKSAVTSNAISALLHAEEIENTVQTILFDESGNVQSITHARDNVAIRTDEFTFADCTITETRTLNTGESLTIVTNTNTLQTTVTYTAA